MPIPTKDQPANSTVALIEMDVAIHMKGAVLATGTIAKNNLVVEGGADDLVVEGGADDLHTEGT